ncbi:SURF1 family protein [Ornithinimicrobium sp. W1665]|uniref:SURF1 family protein n=1 Tax=Ornithinimicrobium sp. W1665 TaxID=3416666 RepID=UPI003CF5B2EA
MIRTALRPPWLALLALLVAVVWAFVQLGTWQIGVSSNEAARERAVEQAARPTEPLGEVTAPHRTFPDDAAGLSVGAEGRYVPEHQFLVPDRLLEGDRGYWVVTPLRTSASGEPALLPVVRGFVTDPSAADRPPESPVRLTGTLAPSESPVEGGPWPPGIRASIDSADLVNDWDEPLFTGFLFLVEEDPALTSAGVDRIPPPVFGESGIVWRNFGYGLQWFVFAAFAVYMYLRFLRDAARGNDTGTARGPDRGPQDGTDPGDGTDPDDGPPGPGAAGIPAARRPLTTTGSRGDHR